MLNETKLFLDYMKAELNKRLFCTKLHSNYQVCGRPAGPHPGFNFFFLNVGVKEWGFTSQMINANSTKKLCQISILEICF